MEQNQIKQEIVMDLSVKVTTAGVDNNGNKVNASISMAELIKYHLDKIASFTISKQLVSFYDKLESVLSGNEGAKEYTQEDFSVAFQIFRQLNLREKVSFFEMIESLNEEFDFQAYESNFKG